MQVSVGGALHHKAALVHAGQQMHVQPGADGVDSLQGSCEVAVCMSASDELASREITMER